MDMTALLVYVQPSCPCVQLGMAQHQIFGHVRVMQLSVVYTGGIAQGWCVLPLQAAARVPKYVLRMMGSFQIERAAAVVTWTAPYLQVCTARPRCIDAAKFPPVG